MPALIEQTRKRPVNLTLNEALVAQAKAYTSNLSMVSVALNQLVERVGALPIRGRPLPMQLTNCGPGLTPLKPRPGTAKTPRV